MSDIKTCYECNEHFHMDDGSQCDCCLSDFCCACDIDNGISFEDLNGDWIYICKDCMELYKINGFKYIQDELFNGEVNDEILQQAIEEYENRLNKFR